MVKLHYKHLWYEQKVHPGETMAAVGMRTRHQTALGYFQAMILKIKHLWGELKQEDFF